MPRRNHPRTPGRVNKKHQAQNRPSKETPLVWAINDVQRVQWQGQWWLMRAVGQTHATKTYRCPGCDQEIVPRTPHVVVWPEHGAFDKGDITLRRHWHTGCWRKRGPHY